MEILHEKGSTTSIESKKLRHPERSPQTNVCKSKDPKRTLKRKDRVIS